LRIRAKRGTSGSMGNGSPPSVSADSSLTV
jgi:hypothetical protein